MRICGLNLDDGGKCSRPLVTINQPAVELRQESAVLRTSLQDEGGWGGVSRTGGAT